ncbi:uncharacterized protein N7496_012604 [Penicillium cataractarum]|uniref:Major facilitator superfamily (MFS) profile domain-containing protein n=1 Tax=Penicillium cataractarum TaxID=2100454 RepID=A0A9W9US73_9EURO|nr:uncharacterized protein N7496_012604 [Penicillium cataractarum]KAJ5355392.1 hypothetical protein N7496_012604 [Penicillium cataractarum]
MEKESPSSHVENATVESHGEEIHVSQSKVNISGTVQLTAGTIVYIPTPTSDPRDPLNMSKWQKAMILIAISIFSTIGLSLVSGFGGLLGFYIPGYAAAGKNYADITSLMTYPTLTMGIGNLIGMPLAIAVGRRLVLIVATAVMVVGAILCAFATDFDWHLGSRMLIGLAAGQSEALVPMITQEIFFLHERSTFLMLQQSIQTIATAIFVLFASPIAEAITPQWWYGLGACLSGASLVLAFFFVPETKYHRSRSSYQESSSTEGLDESSEKEAHTVATERPALDYVNYEARTWRSDLRLWVGSPEWRKGMETFIQSFQLLLFPNVLWAMALNGLTLGVNIAIGTTYGTIVTSEYGWAQKSVSYVNCGQIVTSLLALPVFGFGSDKLIAWFAARRNGIHEPEIRLLPLIFPVIVGTFTAVLYGMGATYPSSYHWFVYVWAVAAYYFTFVGANIVAITYLLDSYPQRASPLLIIICAFRGIISFGVSYGISPFIERNGYDGAFATFGGLTAALGLLGVPVFVWGRKIRAVTGPYTVDKE